MVVRGYRGGWICEAFQQPLPSLFFVNTASSILQKGTFFKSSTRARQFRKISVAAEEYSLSSSAQKDSLEIEEEWNKIHKLIRSLQEQVPEFLYSAPTDGDDSIYSKNICVFVGEKKKDSSEIVSSREELIRLWQWLVWSVSVTTASTTAVLGAAKPPVVQCKLGISEVDPVGVPIELQWSLELTDQNTRRENTNRSSRQLLEGRSQVFTENGKITSFQLQEVSWNGELQDAATIGRFLARTRQAARLVQDNAPSWLQSFSPLLDQVLEVAQGGTSRLDIEEKSKVCVPVFLIQSDINGTETGGVSTGWKPVDNRTAVPPLPGSSRWERYYRRSSALRKFADEILPALSSASTRSEKLKNIDSYFMPETCLCATDGIVLVRGSMRVANFYSRLAAWRQRLFASWNINSVTLLNTVENLSETCKVQVVYNTTIPVPGRSDPITVDGTDVFSLVLASDDDLTTRISKIQQRNISIATAGLVSQDGAWWMRSLVTAMESSQGDDTSILLTTLLPRLLNQGRRPSQLSRTESEMISSMRPDTVALATYRIMEDIHRVSPQLLDTSSVSVDVPGYEYMDSERFRLIGYLGETLVRGRDGYLRSLRLAVRSLRSAILSGSIQVSRQEEPVELKVELTKSGNIRFTLTLFLKLVPMAALPMANEIGNRGSVPFKLEVASDYILCQSTGNILEQQVCETRINDQLTPGDVVSRWIENSPSSADKTEATSRLTDAFRGALSLLQSLSENET